MNFPMGRTDLQFRVLLAAVAAIALMQCSGEQSTASQEDATVTTENTTTGGGQASTETTATDKSADGIWDITLTCANGGIESGKRRPSFGRQQQPSLCTAERGV